VRSDAEREVQRCVRDVMIFVTISPWHSVDLLVVLYRNYRMVSKLTSLYRSRPRVRDQFSILMDLGAVVATVNFLNLGGKLASGLMSQVPVLGKYADDIAQGVGASLFTSIMGHAAIDRLQSFRCWSEKEASKNIKNHLFRHAKDIHAVLRDDVLCQLKNSIKRKKVEQVGNEEWYEDMCSEVEGVVEGALKDTDEYLDEKESRESAAPKEQKESRLSKIRCNVSATVRSGNEKIVQKLKKTGHVVVKSGKRIKKFGGRVSLKIHSRKRDS